MHRLLCALAALALSAAGASAATLQANASNWWTVIRSANGATADVVQLAPDNYGSATLVFPVMQYAAPGITVQPAPGAAVQVPGLSIGQVSNVTVEGLEVLLAPTTQYGVAVENASNITLTGLKIHQADNATLNGTGVFIRNSSGVTVSQSEVYWTGDGIDSLNATGLKVLGNTLHDLNSNGTFHGGVIGALIDGNSFRCFHTAGGSHPDALQISSGSGVRSSNVTITNNVAERGACDLIQGFTGEDTDGLVLAGNAFLGIGGDGVACARCNNLAIDDNLVQIYPGGGAPILVRQASDNVALTNNWAAVYVGVSSDSTQPTNVTQTNNVTPATASGPGDYTVFNAWTAQKAAHTIPAIPAALVSGAPAPVPPPSPTPAPPPAVDPLQATVDAQTAQITTDKTTISGLQAQLAAAPTQATVDGLNAQITSLKAQLASALASSSAAQVKSLQTQLTTANNTLAAIKKAGGWK